MLRHPLLTYFPTQPKQQAIPTIIPSPFHLQPHPLAAEASQLLQQRITQDKNLRRDFFAPNGGKMFGVLVVRDTAGGIGFLSAFSGMMNGQWQQDGFVPPIFDQTEQARFLSHDKAQLSASLERIKQLEHSDERQQLQARLHAIQAQKERDLSHIKARHKAAKAERKQARQALQALPEEEQPWAMRALALASQQHKREATQAALHWRESVSAAEQPLKALEQAIHTLKEQSSAQLRALHQRVWSTYQLYNWQGEQQDIQQFFTDAMPAAGAGDCAGPKLIHYAHQHQLQPLALAEFWWGASPAAGVRHHAHFYPACRGKCRPILPFMLRGLPLEDEPSYGHAMDHTEPDIIYEDAHLLIMNKPSGLMSVAGKYIKDSVFTRLQQRYPDHPELRLVHRLDMDTSGLLLIAKNLPIHKKLQRQFIQRSVEKRYEALLCKRLPDTPNEGDIALPLRVDLDDRPRQLVCYEHGKPAHTHWQIIERRDTTTRIHFYPHTGRTHQLRLHAAHRDGLHAAIVGDDLYGDAAERLMLHAQRLCFEHPIHRTRLCFEVAAPF